MTEQRRKSICDLSRNDSGNASGFDGGLVEVFEHLMMEPNCSRVLRIIVNQEHTSFFCLCSVISASWFGLFIMFGES